LQREEFLNSPAQFDYYDISGTQRRFPLRANSLAFTYCQVPIVHRLGRADAVAIFFEDGSGSQAEELRLNSEISRSIFDRTGMVDRITVSLKPTEFLLL
jgi:hypothetical protein